MIRSALQFLRFSIPTLDNYHIYTSPKLVYHATRIRWGGKIQNHLHRDLPTGREEGSRGAGLWGGNGGRGEVRNTRERGVKTGSEGKDG